jgi:hypothetical protein
MKTFTIPGLPGETFSQYVERVSGLAWQFNGDRTLQIAEIGKVTLDGDKPVGSDLVEEV